MFMFKRVELYHSIHITVAQKINQTEINQYNYMYYKCTTYNYIYVHRLVVAVMKSNNYGSWYMVSKTELTS